MHDEFHVATDCNHAGTFILTVSGELDAATRDRVTAAAATDTNGARECLIDLSGVTFIDASGISGLLNFQRHLRRRDATVTLVGVRPEIERVLRIAGVDDLLRYASQRR